MKKTLGGDRLGAGKKMQVNLHGFERSSHDLGRIWRSSMSAGTLVPFMVEYGMPGDVFNMDLDADVKTYPTLGPLFGSFKLQLDVFQAPIRLYNAMLHNNALGIGMKMNQVKLPEIQFSWTADHNQVTEHRGAFYGKHINGSSIHAYLGIRGLGMTNLAGVQKGEARYNAVPYIAYWDIYKNYYANKQEEIGYVVHGENVNIDYITLTYGTGKKINLLPNTEFSDIVGWNAIGTETVQNYEFFGNGLTDQNVEKFEAAWAKFLPATWIYEKTTGGAKFTRTGTSTTVSVIKKVRVTGGGISSGQIILNKFALANIDDMREKILQKNKASAFTINESDKMPYGLSLKEVNVVHKTKALNTISSYFSQEGLGIKTYQSDIFNNWLSTEWIDGIGGIADITKVDTTGGSFKIDTLNLANKVYDMLNRIAVSGGSYDDWIQANWAHESYRRTESPVYLGGLSKEVVFQEVVGNASGLDEKGAYQPLATLAGKGGLAKKHKGGKVTVKVHEPCVIIGIVSLTPRIDYSQGNMWHINLKTLDDFHKPGLDEIGFQELITEQMAWWEVMRQTEPPHHDVMKATRYSAGKQPAWINYMTSYNQAYGNFADPDKEMYMTLNRRYDYDASNKRIKDLTTYIDPAKYNYLFAYKDLGAQNFWVQIGADITARRKMSAKVMPNL